MTARSFLRVAASLAVVLVAGGSAHAQFLDSFDSSSIPTDPRGLEGWSFFTGDGEATMGLQADEQGHARITVDASRDHRGIWWALIMMIIDWAVEEEPGARTYYTISRPVLQRLVDGRTLGLAIRPLGALVASFRAGLEDEGEGEPRILFHVEE